MRRLSLLFTAPYKVAVEETDVEPPAPGNVLVRTVLSAISPGTELMIYRGQAPADVPVDETIPALRGKFGFPLKYGYSAVGEVVEVGPGVEESWQGRVVFSFHPHESHFTCPPEELIPVPSGIPPEEAAFLPNMEAAVNFLMDGRPAIGEQVAVFGQGVVGLLTTALLARMPLAGLLTVDRYPARRERSVGLGANASVDPSETDAIPTLKALLQGHGEEGGADLVYELSGDPNALDMAIAVTGYSGRIVVGSWYGNRDSRLHLGGRFHRSRIQLVSSQVSTVAPAWSGRWPKSRRMETAWSMVRQVRPGQLVTHRFPLAQASEAYEMLDLHQNEATQVLLTY